MKIGIIGHGRGVRAIQIAQALAILDKGIEITSEPKEFIIKANPQDMDYPASAVRYRDQEPWMAKHKRRRGGRH